MIFFLLSSHQKWLFNIVSTWNDDSYILGMELEYVTANPTLQERTVQ